MYPSQVATFTAGGKLKQELHQFVIRNNFNWLWITYFP